jgi:hypothetical protein
MAALAGAAPTSTQSNIGSFLLKGTSDLNSYSYINALGKLDS